MELYVVQFLTGLANAASLFLVASGLSLIFGVTRIVNFAHGAFYMLGAYIAYSLTVRWQTPLGFWAALLVSSVAVAVVGVIIETLLLRRIYHAPELLQLLATFGVTLIAEDAVRLIWGPEDLVGPRAPGLSGAVSILGRAMPVYDFVLIALGPVVFGLIWLLLHRSRWGLLVRAATQDREMVNALGVNQKWLFTGVFALGVFLAAFGGGLQIPRDAVTHFMDLSIITEVFVIVVIGGLGSIGGAFLAAIIVSQLNAFGILILPGISLVLMFAVMAIVLVLRPWGLLGKPVVRSRSPAAPQGGAWRPFGAKGRISCAIASVMAMLLPFILGDYGISVASEVMIAIIFAISLQFLMSVGGLDSFGQAANLGLGAYGAAMCVQYYGISMELALIVGPLIAAAFAIVAGWFCVRLSNIYFAMLTLAYAQILWSVVFQWVDVTGGDNGIVGVWPSEWASSPEAFYWLTAACAVGVVCAMRYLTFSPFGYSLRALRDSPMRSATIGISQRHVQHVAFVVSAFFAGLAGVLFAFQKGSIFPDALGISTSVDGLIMVLLGGFNTISGSVVGAVVYKVASIWLMSNTDFPRLILGSVIVLLVVLFPQGIVGSTQRLLESWQNRRRQSTTLAAAPAENGGAA
ncbi:ABC transporter permease [Agrobacterium rosae]|uniref:ABC transporter permease n=1 Tax=Agrobacterium rosae TaxID=1972867 RepID=A0AAE5S047_9HYPH|nr:ABC transporter permease [Agrobacterium rosae]KAA3512879.1 ABC transporter permease [Agrobacterium rosae]KAA3521633.1 ABC transporter permease [Agrobacterium rosae]MCM2432480.1 ABC transporter permease [Agrobacterium rosae]MDX8328449.1 ABC transporter permease [Agrobacterium rosae]MQB48566.1 ABC transporter permease [Agrobacterium rosae]